MPETDERELFREIQPLYQNMIVRVLIPLEIIVSIAVIVPLAIGPARQQWGYLLLMLLAVGVVLPWWIMSIKLVTVVTDGRLLIRFSCLPGRQIDPLKITHAEALKYHPIRDGGGWGWRMSPKYHRIFNISGDRGVHVRFGQGRRDQFLVGSLKPEELAEAIELVRFAAAERTT